MNDKTIIDNKLLINIKEKLPELERLMERVNSHWSYEDYIYRFYHQSFKVYPIQEVTKKIIEALKSLAPEECDFCNYFKEIINLGARGTNFKLEHNRNWTKHTRVFLEAFFHAKFFLEMTVKYGKELEEAPSLMSSGWAPLLCLYNIR